MKRNSDSGNDAGQYGSGCTDPRSKTEGAVTIKLLCSLLQPANFSSDFSAKMADAALCGRSPEKIKKGPAIYH